MKLTEAERTRRLEQKERSAQLVNTLLDAAADVLRDRGRLVVRQTSESDWCAALEVAEEGALTAALRKSAPVNALCAALADRHDELTDKPALVKSLELDADDLQQVCADAGVGLADRAMEAALRLAWCEDWAQWRGLQVRLREEMRCLGATSDRSWPLPGLTSA